MYIRALEDARRARDVLSNQVNENEKKLKTLDTAQRLEDLSGAERAMRAIETERDEILEEVNNNAVSQKAIADER